MGLAAVALSGAGAGAGVVDFSPVHEKTSVDSKIMLMVAGNDDRFTVALLGLLSQRWDDGSIFTKRLRQVNLIVLLAWLAAAALTAPVVAAGTLPAGSPVPPRHLHIVFLLAQFPDLALERQRSYFTDSETREGLAERLVDYYAEESGGRLVIEKTVAVSVVTLPGKRESYIQRPAVLTRDAFTAFAAEHKDDVARGALEAADAVIVFFAGAGKESDLKGAARDPWSNFTQVQPALVSPGGHRIAKGCVIAAKQSEGLSSFGVLCHEFGHLLGLPELYAPGGAKHEGIGVWGLMGQGTWLGMGDRPPHLSAWSKVQMGWADVNLVMGSGRVELPAIGAKMRLVKIWARGPEHPREYFLVANRQRRSTDRRLPGSGLLIWHIDERVTGYRTSQSNPDHMRVTLMQADGRDDLRVGHRGGGNRGDAGDPWRGMEGRWRLLLDVAIALGAIWMLIASVRVWRRRILDWVAAIGVALAIAAFLVGLGVSRSPRFGPETVPSSASWDGDAGRFTISDISPAGDPMSFTVTVHPGS